MTIGMISISSEITPTAALTWGPEADSGILKIVSIGVIRKTNGSTAIVTITKRLRRNSRTSLRTTSGRAAGSCARLDVVVDELEVDVLERVLTLGEREQIGAGGDERTRHRGAASARR